MGKKLHVFLKLNGQEKRLSQSNSLGQKKERRAVSFNLKKIFFMNIPLKRIVFVS